MPSTHILVGDVRERIRDIPDASVQTCVTSPPYWGLRDYGTASWTGGSDMYECEPCGVVERIERLSSGCPKCGQTMTPTTCVHQVGGQVQDSKAPGAIVTGQRPGVDASTCRKCGASRIDQQIGLEQTPEEYVAEMVAVFRDVRRCLRDDGTLWLNIGDSYAASSGGGQGKNGCVVDRSAARLGVREGHIDRVKASGLKPKDLVGIPWRVAFALQADGWFLLSDIIWAKPNPMPESVRDRPTKAHEYVFLLSKSGRYFYDADAIAEEALQPPGEPSFVAQHKQSALNANQTGTLGTNQGATTRNARTVWTISTHPFPGSHFAVMPPELAEKCIRAGSSERGCCPECESPWVREVEHTKAVIKRSERTHSKGQTRSSGTQLLPASSVTTGWRPSCNHGAPPVPCRVLDPFGGAGTTALVANRLGRDAVICELNHDYAQMARARIHADAPMFNNVSVLGR